MESQIRNTISLELRRQGVGPAGEEPLQRALSISMGDVTSSLRINGSGLALGDRAVVGLCEALLKLIIAERGTSAASSVDTAHSKSTPLLPREWYIDLSSNNLTDRCAPHIQLLISRGCTLPDNHLLTTSTSLPLQNIDPNTQHHHHRLGTLSTRLRHLDVSGNLFSEGKGLKRLMGTWSKVLEEIGPRTSATGVPTILLCDADHGDANVKSKPQKLGLGSILARAEAVGGAGSSSASTSATGTAGGGIGRGSSILGDGSIASGPIHKHGLEPVDTTATSPSPIPPPVVLPFSPTSHDASLPTVSLSMSSPVITVTPGSPVTPAVDPRAQTQTPLSHRQPEGDSTPEGKQSGAFAAIARPTFVDYDVAEVGGATLGDDSIVNGQQISFPHSIAGSEDGGATHDADEGYIGSPASTAVPPSSQNTASGLPPLAVGETTTTANGAAGRTTTVSLMGKRSILTNSNKDGLEASGDGGGIMARTASTNLIASTSQSGAHPDVHANSRRRATSSSELVTQKPSFTTLPAASNTTTTPSAAPSRPPAPITAQDYVDVCGGTAPTKLLDKKGNYASSMVHEEEVPIVDGGAVLVLSDQLPQLRQLPQHDMMARFQRAVLAPIPVGSQMVNVTVLSIANNRLTHLPLLPPHLTRLDASYNHLSFAPYRFGEDVSTSTPTTMSTTLEEGSPEADAAISLARTLSECPYLRIVNLRHNHLPGMGFTITSSTSNGGLGNNTSSQYNTSASRSVHNTSIGLSGPTPASRHSQQYSSLFAGNKCLVHLFMGCNAVTSVDGVGHCPLLETLDLGHNYIRSEAAIRALSLNSDSLKHVILEGNPILSNPKLYTLKGSSSKNAITPIYPTMAHMLEVSARKYQRNLRNLCPSLLVIDNVPLSFSSVADAKRREWDSVLGTNTSAHQSSTSVLHRSSCTVGGYSGSARASAAATAALKAQEAKLARSIRQNNTTHSNSYMRGPNASLQSGGDLSVAYAVPGGGRMLQMSGGGGGGSDGPFNPGVFVVTSDNGLVNSSTFVPPSNTAAPDRSSEAQRAVGASLRGGPNSSLYAGFTYRSKNQTYNTTHNPQDGGAAANLRTRSAALEALNTIAEAANQNATDRITSGTHISYERTYNNGTDESTNWSPPNTRSGAPRDSSSLGAANGMNSSRIHNSTTNSSSSPALATSSDTSSSTDTSSDSDTSSLSSSERLISMSPEMQPPASYFPYDPASDPPLKSSLRIRQSPSPTALTPPLGSFRAGTPLDVAAESKQPVGPLTPTDVTDAFLRAISRTRHSSTCPSTDGQQSSSFNARQQAMVSTDRAPTDHPSSTPPSAAATTTAIVVESTQPSISRLRSPASAQVRDAGAVDGKPAAVTANAIGSMSKPPVESSSSEEEDEGPSIDDRREHSPPPNHPEPKPQPLHLSQVLSILNGSNEIHHPSITSQSSPRMGSTSTVDAADVLDPESPIPTSSTTPNTKRGAAKVVLPPTGIKAVASNSSRHKHNHHGAVVRGTSSVGLGSEDFGEEWDGEDDRVYNNPSHRQASTASTATTVKSTGSGEELFLKTWREHVASGDGHSANSSPSSMPLQAIAERLLSNTNNKTKGGGGSEEEELFSTTLVSKADKFAMSDNSMGTALAGELKEIQGFMLEGAASMDDAANKHIKQPSKATTPRGKGDHMRVNKAMPPTATTTASTAIAASSDREYNPLDESNIDAPHHHGRKGRLSFFPEEVEEGSTTTAATARHSSPREDMTREPSSVAARTAYSTGEFYINSYSGQPPRASSMTVAPLSPSDDDEDASTSREQKSNSIEVRNIPPPELSIPDLHHDEAGSCYDDAPNAIRQDAAARARDAAYLESIHRRVDELNSGAYGFGMVVPQPSHPTNHNGRSSRQAPHPITGARQPLLTNSSSSFPTPVVLDSNGGDVYPLLGGQRPKTSRTGRAPSITTAPQPIVNGQTLSLASPAYYPEIAVAASHGHVTEHTPTSTRRHHIAPPSPSPNPSTATQNNANKPPPMTVATPLPSRPQHHHNPVAVSAGGRGRRMPSPSPVPPPSINPTTLRWSQELDSDVVATKAALRTLLSILQSQQATLLKYMKANPKEYPASGVKTSNHGDGGSSEVLAAQYDPVSLRAAHSSLQGLASTLLVENSSPRHRKQARIVSPPPEEEDTVISAVLPRTPTDQRLNHHSMAPLSPMDDSYSSPRIAYGEPIIEHLHTLPNKTVQPTPVITKSTTTTAAATKRDAAHHRDDAPLARAYQSWCDERTQCNTTITLAGLLLDTQIPESAAVELGLTVELLTQISSALSNDALDQLIANHHCDSASSAIVEEVRGKVVRNLRDASEGKTCLRYIGACLQAGREDLLVRYVAALQNVL